MMSCGIPAICFWKFKKLDAKDKIILIILGIIALTAFAGALLSIIDPA